MSRHRHSGFRFAARNDGAGARQVGSRAMVIVPVGTTPEPAALLPGAQRQNGFASPNAAWARAAAARSPALRLS